MLSAGADYSTIYKHATRFVIIPEGYEACAAYPTMWRPIPAEICDTGRIFELRTGLIPNGKRCAVVLGFDGGAENFEVEINGTPVAGFRKISIGFIEGIGYQPKNAVPENTVCYSAKFDESLLLSPKQSVTVRSRIGVPTITWVEINVY